MSIVGKVLGKAAQRTAARAKADAIREAAVDAPAGAVRRFKEGEKAGIYAGTEAFGGITPQKLGKMRKDYYAHVERGARIGADKWYDRTSQTIYDLTGRDPLQADKVADALAVTSANTPVGQNLMFAAKGVNQAAVGDPVRTGMFPNTMGPRIEAAWEQEVAGAGLGLKRSPYRAGLSVAWRGPQEVQRATHDIHDVRAWGIVDPKTGEPWSKGVGEAGHRFLDEQTKYIVDLANARALGGRTDWMPHQTQAAAWVSQKAAHKGVPLEEAAKDYTDFVNQYSAMITREWPTSVPEHLPELARAPFAIQREYSDAMEKLVRNAAGGDRLVTETGGLSPSTLTNLGIYEGQVGPGFASRVLFGKETGKAAVDPASRRYLDALAAAHGTLGTQKQVAWNARVGDAPVSRANVFDVVMGRPATEAEIAAAARVVGDDAVPMVGPDGLRVLDFSTDPAVKRARAEALRNMQLGEVRPGIAETNLVPQGPKGFSYAPLLDAMEVAGPRFVTNMSRVMQSVAPQVLAKTREFSKKYGWTEAPWFEAAMKALSEGGLPKLRELQRAGIVPVGFVALVAGQLDEEN
ncbi:MAG: hypothetical protein RMK97_02010 [Sutterellaceae bacterium]|nr:hypothetical protein [Burkholderiaceae bacterium]MDW8429269.1 hypothetical protein [Sutterellaceae bacterium]